MKPYLLLTLLLLAHMAKGAEVDSLASKQVFPLSLSGAIAMAQEESVALAEAENTMLVADWNYRLYKAELLPELSFTGTLPSYQQNYVSYQHSDGSYSFVQNNYLGLEGGLYVSQKIPFTGGSLYLESSVDYIRQLGDESSTQFMSVPIKLTLYQPLFGVNDTKWDKKIEPLVYEESMREYKEDLITISLSVTTLYFNALIAKSSLQIAEENLKNADFLYRIAQAKREKGSISQRDVDQLRLQALQAKATLTDAQSSMRSQMFQLTAYLGLSDDVELDITLPEYTPEGQISYRVALDLALSQGSFSTNVQRRDLQADYSVAEAKGNRRQIDLYASYGSSGVDDSWRNSYLNPTRNQFLQVGFSIPILDWGSGRAQVEIAQRNRQVVDAQLEQEEISFRQELFLLVENFNNHAAQVEIARESNTLASEGYDIVLQTFISGDTDILSLNDARSDKDTAQQTLVQQTYMYWYYYYQIELYCLEKLENIVAKSK
ncbi:MAG: TolC family protein [Rikenellaceae bacterium]